MNGVDGTYREIWTLDQMLAGSTDRHMVGIKIAVPGQHPLIASFELNSLERRFETGFGDPWRLQKAHPRRPMFRLRWVCFPRLLI